MYSIAYDGKATYMVLGSKYDVQQMFSKLYDVQKLMMFRCAYMMFRS
jgi:hypothetical protein